MWLHCFLIQRGSEIDVLLYVRVVRLLIWLPGFPPSLCCCCFSLVVYRVKLATLALIIKMLIYTARYY